MNLSTRNIKYYFIFLVFSYNKYVFIFLFLNIMNIQKTKAFTLVELIVVITILSILGTIAFISLQWYSAQSRDAVRNSDLSSIKTGLELYNLDAGKYPSPNDETVITYSWAVAWTQWTFWEQAKKNIDKLDKVPTDPLTDKKYVYSTNSTRYEFQLAWAMEGDEISYSPRPWGEGLGVRAVSAASTKTAKLKITWNYNGKLLKVTTGSTDYVLAMPSIMTMSGSTVETITANNLLAYNWYKNLPFQYDGTYKTDWETTLSLVSTTNYVVFSWSLSTLSDSTSTWINARKVMLDKLQLAYSWTEITWIWEIAQILNTNTSDPTATEYVATNLVANNLWGSIVASTTSASSTGALTPTATGWMAIDSNCDIPDITISGFTWAWCNSTIWNGIEWWKQDNGSNAWIMTCYNYDFVNNWTCTIWDVTMLSSTKANTWYSWTNANGDTEYAAIWWKFYTWSNISSACPSWRHVPSDFEFGTFENALYWSVCRVWNNFNCSWIWWMSHNTKNITNNLAQALRIPLAGDRYVDSNAQARWYWAHFWTSTEANGVTAYWRLLLSNNTWVDRQNRDKTFWLSVRCLKD